MLPPSRQGFQQNKNLRKGPSNLSSFSSPSPKEMERKSKTNTDGNSLDILGPQPVLSKAFSLFSTKEGVKESDLRDGDLFVMMGSSPLSCCTCSLVFSFVVSHCGIVLTLDGKKWLVEATSWKEEDIPLYVVDNSEESKNGVVASSIEESKNYYSAIDVYRPKDMTPDRVRKLKESFRKYAGKPYEKSFFHLMNVCLGLPIVPTRNSLFCSELTALMYDEAGMAHDINRLGCGPDWRRKGHHYRPNQISSIIDCDYVGHLDGTRSIYDPRAWMSSLFLGCSRSCKSCAAS